MLGQIDSRRSTHALSILAVVSDSGAVRGTAIQTLRLRDPRDVATALVALLRDPVLDPDPILYHYYVQLVGAESIGSPGVLSVRGARYNVVRQYTVDDTFGPAALGVPNPTPSPGYALAVSNQTRRQANDLAAAVNQILQESADQVAAARLHVLQVGQLNARIVEVLGGAIGRDLGKDREAARKWWTEEQGYAYHAPAPSARQDWTLDDDNPTYFFGSVHSSCFAVDTPVLAIDGPKPIQSLQVGDQVLVQDPQTGALSYQPVMEALHNKPAMLIKIKAGTDVIKATGIHRFWKAGSGWVMARDVRAGDRLRSLEGVVEVTSVEGGRVQPVFNLRVRNGQTYFAGERKLLVHDSSLVESVQEPFDAVPYLGTVAKSD